MAGPRHALTLRWKSQRSHPNPNPRELTFARSGSACRYDCTFLWFSVFLLRCIRSTTYCDERVRMSVCLSVRCIISQKPLTNFTKFSAHVNCCRSDSVLLWRQWNTLYTSGFVHDVMFSYNGTNEPESKITWCFVEFARWQHRQRSCCLRWQACCTWNCCRKRLTATQCLQHPWLKVLSRLHWVMCVYIHLSVWLIIYTVVKVSFSHIQSGNDIDDRWQTKCRQNFSTFVYTCTSCTISQ